MPEFPETNLRLIARVKDPADGVAWIEFLELYQPVVYRMARRRGLQDADAQDVIQQVLSSVSKSVARWVADEAQPPFRAWLTTITRNAIVKAMTRRPRDQATGSTSVLRRLHAEPDRLETTTEIVHETRREIVRRAASQIRREFSESTWDLFWKTSIEGVSVAAMSESTGKSTGAIYVARYRVITRLKEKISEVAEQWEAHQP